MVPIILYRFKVLPLQYRKQTAQLMPSPMTWLVVITFTSKPARQIMRAAKYVITTASLSYIHAHKHSSMTSNCNHYNDVIMGTIASQLTSIMTVYSTIYSDADQRKHQSSVSLAFVGGIHRGPVTQKIFPFDDVIMIFCSQMHNYDLKFHCRV